MSAILLHNPSAAKHLVAAPEASHTLVALQASHAKVLIDLRRSQKAALAEAAKAMQALKEELVEAHNRMGVLAREITVLTNWLAEKETLYRADRDAQEARIAVLEARVLEKDRELDTCKTERDAFRAMLLKVKEEIHAAKYVLHPTVGFFRYSPMLQRVYKDEF